MTKKTYTLFHNKNIQYLFIVIYSLIVVFLIKWGGLYGSEVDWLAQHTVFPEIFRNHYYETGDILPKFLFNVGAGQNAFNFAYYGLLSPFVILSFALPSVNMITYISVTSIILFVLTGVLTKKFVTAHLGDKAGFWAAVILLSMAPLNLHFHRHIMFVWYFPFLILALVGLDKYFQKNKPGLFVICTALIIFTNYLYAVPCLMVLYVYAIYKIISTMENEFSWKVFFKKLLPVTFVFAIPVMMSAILLLPTAQSLMSNERPTEKAVDFIRVIIPEAEDFFYSGYAMGITFTMFIATIGNLTCKSLKKSDRFLNIALMILVLCPFVLFALNGFLYVRGKMLIPFVVLYIYNLFIFIENLRNKQVNCRLTAIAAIIFAVIVSFSGYNIIIFKIGFFAGLMLELAIWRCSLKNLKAIPVYTAVICLLVSVIGYHSDITGDHIKNMHYDDAEYLAESIDQEGFYRTNVAHNEYNNSNKIYSNRHNGSSIFSSTYNGLYWDFYFNKIGNNFNDECKLVTAWSRNELFHTYMGTRYIIAPDDPGFLYEKIKAGQTFNLYENKHYYPVAYKSKSIMSEAEFDKTRFPYSLAHLMNSTVISGDAVCDYEPDITKIDVPAEYVFENRAEKNYQIDLGKKYAGKYLYLTFEIYNEGEYINPDNLQITINGCPNLLSGYYTVYYNDNNKFEYVLPLEGNAILDITVSKGKFNIKNLEMYTSDAIHRQYESVNDLKINKNKDRFTCNTVAKKGEYLVTTIPYDPNFKAFVNGKETEIITVNKAFMGIKLTEGTNNIRFEYTSAFCTAGYVVSAIGIILFAVLMCYNKIRKRSHKSV